WGPGRGPEVDARVKRSAPAPPGRAERVGGWGPCRGPEVDARVKRSAPAPPGRAERVGVWGPFLGPHVHKTILIRPSRSSHRRSLPFWALARRGYAGLREGCA